MQAAGCGGIQEGVSAANQVCSGCACVSGASALLDAWCNTVYMYKRDLRRVYRFYASIGAKSRVRASGGRMGILQWGNLVADTKILARDEAGMQGRGLATSVNMTQTVCDTVFLHSCAMQRWNPSADAPPLPPSAAVVDDARGGMEGEFVGTHIALNRKGFYAALCRLAAQMRPTDPLPDALADLLR